MTVIFGFVREFGSLATYAGFVTAGVAVALQSPILSVVAYFFLIGRYGIRVGDRVTISGVTGDVIEIGFVRFTLMELAGTGPDLHSTGIHGRGPSVHGAISGRDSAGRGDGQRNSASTTRRCC
jgi:hypothetical protein